MYDKHYEKVQNGDVVSFVDNDYQGESVMRIGEIFDFDGSGIYVKKITGLNVYRRVYSDEITKLDDASAMLWKLENA